MQEKRKGAMNNPRFISVFYFLPTLSQRIPNTSAAGVVHFSSVNLLIFFSAKAESKLSFKTYKKYDLFHFFLSENT